MAEKIVQQLVPIAFSQHVFQSHFIIFHQNGNLIYQPDGIDGGFFHSFQHEQYPRLPITTLADVLYLLVVFRFIVNDVSAQVEKIGKSSKSFTTRKRILMMRPVLPLPS